MVIINESQRNGQIVVRLSEYAKSKGLLFNERRNGLSDSSPYYLLRGGSSLSYRKQSRKWPEKGIVVFATDTDAKNLKRELGLRIYDNSKDRDRPNAVFIPKDQFDKAIDVLKMNKANI